MIQSNDLLDWYYKFEVTDIRAVIPEHITAFSAGLDITTIESKLIMPGECVVLRTGLKVRFFVRKSIHGVLSLRPYIMIVSRSGLTKRQIYVPSPGIIDSDYKGEIYVNLCNSSSIAYQVNEGDRVAQGLTHFILPKPSIYKHVDLADYMEVQSERGSGGFGSTGK